MIWALAGLGASGPYSTYNAEYTPAQKDAPVVIVEEKAGFPWALAGLVAIGLGVAYAGYRKDEFEPNKKGHIRRKVAPWAKGRFHVIFARLNQRLSDEEKKKAERALRSVGATKVKSSFVNRRGSKGWVVGGYVAGRKIQSLRSKLPKRIIRAMRVQDA